MEQLEKVKLFTDGGARGNPGPAACACLVFNYEDKLIAFDGAYLGDTTNNTAEYRGLILGLELASKYTTNLVECYLDSELVVKQLIGEYKIKHPNIVQEKSKLDKILVKFNSVKFNHIRREFNSYADKLVNIILDAREQKI